jgi:hypothetical protein
MPRQDKIVQAGTTVHETSNKTANITEQQVPASRYLLPDVSESSQS